MPPATSIVHALMGLILLHDSRAVVHLALLFNLWQVSPSAIAALRDELSAPLLSQSCCCCAQQAHDLQRQPWLQYLLQYCAPPLLGSVSDPCIL